MLQKFLALLFLKAAPQDIPYSQQWAGLAAALYVISGYMVLQSSMAPDDMVPGLLLSLAVQLIFTFIVLRALNKGARFVQTITATLGISILFNLLSWPALSVLADEALEAGVRSSMSLLFLMLISWEVLVKAHIYRHALEIKMFSALTLSFSLLFISVALSQMVFPGEVT